MAWIVRVVRIYGFGTALGQGHPPGFEGPCGSQRSGHRPAHPPPTEPLQDDGLAAVSRQETA